MLDFPNTPTVGQQFTTPSGVFIWDGTKWAPSGHGVTVSDTAPSNPSVGQMWFDSSAALLYIWFNDGTSSQWVDANNIAGAITSSAVRYDAAQTLSADSGTTIGQCTQARSNIYAAPFDALAYNGMQINGSMEVSQENGNTQIYGGPGGTGVIKYIQDGVMILSAGGQSISYGGISAQPTFVPGYGGNASYWVNTANPSPASGDYLFFKCPIEGFRIARLAWGTANAQPISIGFWFRCGVAGTFSLAIRNSANNRSYVTPLTVNNAGTWEWKTFTIPGDTSGTWQAGNGLGLSIEITLMAGSSLKGAPNVWSGGGYIATTSSGNAISTTAGGANLTGLIVLPGLELPLASRAPFIMRPYDQELMACKRYFHMYGGVANFDKVGGGISVNASTVVVLATLPVSLRTYPQLVVSSNSDFSVTNGVSNPTMTGISVDGYANSNLLSLNASASVTAGSYYVLQANNTTNARLKVDARLVLV